MANYLVALSALTVVAISLVNGTAGDIRILQRPLLLYLNRSNLSGRLYGQ